MRIRIISVTPVSDGRGHRYQHGQEVTVEDKLAKDWIQAGHAEPATPAPDDSKPSGRREPHKAVKAAPRKAVRRS